MTVQTTVVNEERKYDRLFSVCTIVNRHSEYEEMKGSFISNGFEADCEYLIVDNAERNAMDAYAGIRRFLQEAKGKYLIIVHQDVRCQESREKLVEKLNELECKDPSWAICGNAGGNGYKNFIFNLDNNGKLKKSKGLPAKVTSLDENFLVIKSDCQLSVSADIDGFHFYGTDLCIIADILGYNCYVIDFLVAHLSSGNLEQMEEFKPKFIESYGRKLRNRFIQTTCSKFYLSNGKGSNSFYNKPFIFFWVKAKNRLVNAMKRL